MTLRAKNYIRKKKQLSISSDKLCSPKKVTIDWLIKHVPYKMWIVCISLFSTVFWIGVESSNLAIIREIRQKIPITTVQPKSIEGYVHTSAITHDTDRPFIIGTMVVVRTGGTILRISPSLDADGTNINAGAKLKVIRVNGEWIKANILMEK